MTALYIIGGILLLLLLLLLVKVGVYFAYYGTVPELTVKIGFIKLSYNLKELKKDTAEIDEADIEAVKAKRKKKKAKEEKASPAIKDSLRVFKAGVIKFYNKYKKYARLEKYVVKISLATDDPAKTAILYGGVATVAASLHAWATSVKKRSRKIEDLYTEVRPDFIAEKTDAAAEIGFSLRVWQILSCALTLYGTYRKYKKLPKKNKKKGNIEDDKRQA